MLSLCISLAHSLPRIRGYGGDRDYALKYTLKDYYFHSSAK
jgi:hypothetical protein